MSRASSDVMRRAFLICSRRFSLQHRPIPAPASSRDFPVPCQHAPKPRTTFYFPVRYFSDVQTRSEELESEKQPSDPTTSKFKSPFLEKLDRCNSPSDVLDLTCRFAPTARQLSHCLSQMWNSTKKMTEEQRRLELQLMWEHQAWERLLQQAMAGAGQLPDEHLVYALLALVKLGVAPKTRVVQSYLRAAQERINEFDDKSLSILSSCLENMEDGANVKALKDGIRLLVEARLPRISNVVHLQTMMRLVGRDAPLKLKQKLETKALSLSEQFSLPNAQYMVSTMAAMGFYSRPLLSVCSRKIIESLDGIPFNRLLTVLVSCRDLRFRDLDLLSAVSEYAASMVDVWTNKQLILLLFSLESLSFCPSALMDSYSQRFLFNPGALTLRDLLCVLKVCSSLNFHRDRLVDVLTQALDQYLLKMSPVQLLKAVHSLCVMGHFPPALLQQLLQESTLQQLREKEARFVQSQLRVVDLCLRLDRPELPEPLSVPSSLLSDSSAPVCDSEPQPSSSSSQAPVCDSEPQPSSSSSQAPVCDSEPQPSSSSSQAPVCDSEPQPSSSSSQAPVCDSKPHFSTALLSLMGSREEWAVREGQLLEEHYYIDAALTKEEPRVSDTDLSPAAEGSQRVAVLCVPSSVFCYGTSHPRGPLALKLRHLRILGYQPVVVPEQELLALSEEQRVEFLRERIFNHDVSHLTPEKPAERPM